MASAHTEMNSPTYTTLPDWRRDDTRNIRSNAKAERVLGVANYNNLLPNGRIKKKASALNFSLFSDLKDALPTLHRKASRTKVHAKASDTESMDSTPSPTFDPAASTNSLDTVNSSPVTPKRYPEVSHPKPVETLPQAELAKVKKFTMPSIKENNQLTYLAPSSECGQEIAFGIRKNSDSSIVLFQLEDQSIPQTGLAKMNQAIPPMQAAKPILPDTMAGKHVQDWLESAQLDRRPSLLTRSSTLPVPELAVSALSSSSDSIQTLTSEAKEGAATPTAQWPLPSGGLPPPRRTRRIQKSNLQVESILTLSSDEDDSDGGNEWRKSDRSYKRKSNSTVKRLSRQTHQREVSTTSSVIQLDSRPLVRPTPSYTYRVFPKRTLADIAASAASRPMSGDSWETDLIADADGAEAIPPEEAVLDFLASSLESDTTGLRHPLWRSSTGSSDIDIRISRPAPPVQTLQTLFEEETPEQVLSPEDELLAEVNVADFPVPPRSRSGSVVPSIHVQHIDDTRKAASSTAPAFSAHDTILLAPSVVSRSGSTKSEHSVALRPSRQPSPSLEADKKQDRTIETIMRKRTISNVPVYVTGLESSTDGECENGDVAFFVHSSIF